MLSEGGLSEGQSHAVEASLPASPRNGGRSPRLRNKGGQICVLMSWGKCNATTRFAGAKRRDRLGTVRRVQCRCICGFCVRTPPGSPQEERRRLAQNPGGGCLHR